MPDDDGRKILREFTAGQPVYVRNYLTGKWEPGKVKRQREESQNYDVTTDLNPETIFHRNRIDLRQ